MSETTENPDQKSEEKSEPKEMGRPTIYSQEIADEICNRLAHGETLRTIIASSPHLPSRTTIYRWNADNEDFRNQYTKARAEQADYYAELIVDESYSSHDAGIGRLRVDALKWAASKMAPKKYGDKIEIDTAQPLTLAFQLPSRAPERVQLESNERSLEE
jgi:methionine synthase II (cobalamin-independent)